MKLMKNTLFVGLALALPLSLSTQNVSLADTLNVDGPTAADVAAQVHAAKDRLSTSKVRLSIAKKQVIAAKARLKAAEAEFRAAKANHSARNLQHEAHKLAESSGLPAITNSLIEQNKTRSLASKAVENLEKKEVKPEVPKAMDLSQTRIQQVDFNAPAYKNPASNTSTPVTPHSSSVVPSGNLSTGARPVMPSPRVSAVSTVSTGTGLVANTPTALEQPPLVP